jgi:hypothetical protein
MFIADNKVHKITVKVLYTAPPGPSLCLGFMITLRHTTFDRSPLIRWSGDQSIARTCTWQHTTLTRDRHPCYGGIRTHNPSKQVKQAAADLHLRMHAHWDQLLYPMSSLMYLLISRTDITIFLSLDVLSSSLLSPHSLFPFHHHSHNLIHIHNPNDKQIRQHSRC